MSQTQTSSRVLPASPSEGYLRKEAKRLARGGAMQLAAAQRQLAHEYGYRNWAELMIAVQSMASSRGDGGAADPSQPRRLQPPANAHEFPLLALRGLVTFPHVSYPVFVGRPSSIKAVRHAVENQIPIVMATQRDAARSEISGSDLYDVGVIASVVQMLSLPDGTLKTVVEGKLRARINRFILDQDYAKAEAVEIEEAAAPGASVEGLIASLISAFMTRQLDKIAEPEGWSVGATTSDQASIIADRITSRLPMNIAMKQALLELLNPSERLEKLLAYLNAWRT